MFLAFIQSNLLLLVFPPVSCLRWTTSGLSTTCLLPCSFSSSSVLWLLISLMKEGKEDQDYHFILFFNWFSTIKLSSNSCLLFFHHPRLVLDFDLLVFAFGQIPLVVCTWICMFLSVLVVPFALFHLWSQTQSGNPSHPRLCSVLFASIYLLYQFFALGFLPTYIVVTNSLPPASRFIVIMEQVRGQIAINAFLYLRKPVAYISEYLRCAWWWKPTPSSGRMYRGSWPGLKTKRVWKFILSSVLATCRWIPCFHLLPCVPEVDDEQSVLSSAGPSPVLPQVSQYLYFLFAPTLIYRDKYPRYKHTLSVVETGRS